jgi:hypothetical protein
MKASVEDRSRARAAFRVCAGLGALLIAMTIVMVALSTFEAGRLPAGYHTPILAFELVQSAAEVEALFGAAGSPERTRIVSAMDRLNAVDYAFMVLYGGMLAVFGVAWRRAGVRAGSTVAGLAVFAALMDAVENLALFSISAALGGEYGGALRLLAWSTWSKWGALAAAFALLVPALARRGRGWFVAAVLFALPLPLSALAFAQRGMAAEAMSTAIGIAFLTAWILAMLEARRAASR